MTKDQSDNKYSNSLWKGLFFECE